MKCLLVHTSYLNPGGEDTVFAIEASLLECQGITVLPVRFHNSSFSNAAGPLSKGMGAIRTVWNNSSRALLTEACSLLKPDIVHVHNTFQAASPSIYSAAHQHGAAVVQTLHNYRLLCPNSLLFRDGRICEDCLGKFVPWPGVAHACYRNSRAQTGVSAAMLTFHRARRTWHREVDRFIALTEFSRQKFVDGGLPAEKVVVKPNFLTDDPGIGAGGTDFLFVGRLDEAKGVRTLLDASEALDAVPLLLAGSGPLDKVVTDAATELRAVDYLGRLDRKAVLAQMQRARALVFSSLWYEAFPMTIVEAFACGLPVIASNLGSMAEIIQDHRTGLLFEPGNAADLGAKLRWANDHPEKMREYGMNARREYELKYTAERNYEMLMDIYQQAIDHRITHPPARWST